MKKKSTIIIGILFVTGITGIALYKKNQKAEVKAKQEAVQREQAKQILQQQREAEIQKYKEEEKRINDSIAAAQQTKLNEGLQMLREAKENLDYENN